MLVDAEVEGVVAAADVDEVLVGRGLCLSSPLHALAARRTTASATDAAARLNA